MVMTTVQSVGVTPPPPHPHRLEVVATDWGSLLLETVATCETITMHVCWVVVLHQQDSNTLSLRILGSTGSGFPHYSIVWRNERDVILHSGKQITAVHYITCIFFIYYIFLFLWPLSDVLIIQTM